MTENEAIKVINDKYETFFALSTTNDFDMAMATAIKALEEIQAYRAIGTVDEFKYLKENQFFNFDSPIARIDKKSYDKAIDEFAERLKESLLNNWRYFLRTDSHGFDWITTDAVHTHIEELLKRMKGDNE